MLMVIPSFHSHRLRWSAVLLVLAVLAWAALAPLRYPTRERLLEFPNGTAVLAGKSVAPSGLELTLGVRDVLLLRNRDMVPHVFGQVRVLPGHEFRLPFEQAGVFVFACDAVPGARFVVHVGPHPDPGWPRLRWRLRAFVEAVRTLPLQGPED
jgi:hypothetical protein